MVQRHSLDRVIGSASAVMLAVAVLSSPIRLPRSSGGQARPDCLRRNFGLPCKQSSSTRASVSSLGSTPVRVKAITSESEKDVVKLSRTPGYIQPLPPVAPPILHPARLATGQDHAVHPLRC